ncbi:MAG: hypothetical protein U0836_26950 [Pirellulales bacterium]
MTRSELKAWLLITDKQVDKLLARGMPAAAGSQFDADAVAQWLSANGLAESTADDKPPAGHVRTVRELAAALGRSRPTVAGWLSEGGAPGPDERGFYSIAAVRQWREQRDRDLRRPGATAPYLSDARLTHLMRVHTAWERAELQARGVPEPEQSRAVVHLVYSVMTLLDQAGLDVGSPQPALLEALGLTAAAAECERWYGTKPGRAFLDAHERLTTGLPTY